MYLTKQKQKVQVSIGQKDWKFVEPETYNYNKVYYRYR